MRRTKLNVVGHSTTSELKAEIQRLVRLICCYRDGGCVLRNLRHCGGEAFIEDDKIFGNNVIQADHLITRANSATYGDTRLIVCLCKNCHAWKKWNDKQYDALVKTVISKDRVDLWDKCLKDSWKPVRTGATDWQMVILALKQELAKFTDL